MPKVGVSPIRQGQIIRAAIETIHQDGLVQTSLREIGRRANVSPSLITHYFGNRDALYVEVLRYLNRRLSLTTAASLRMAATPKDRLLAIGRANFDPEHFEPSTASAWFALWGKLPEIPELQRFQRIYERRLYSNVRDAMRRLAPPAELDRAIDLFIAVVDGLWVKAAQPTSSIDAANALEAFSAFVDMLVSHLESRGARSHDL